ncbi:MAG: hypothetical protein Tsb0014_10070 [Pleurocapsa sp.]
MTDLTKDISLAQTLALIDSYDFDLGGYSAEELIQDWLDIYHISWIRLATIEALYQGRYKTVSIEQILGVWFRMGNPNPHFSYEFERLICRKLPRHLIDISQDLENSAVSKYNISQIPKPSPAVKLTETLTELQNHSESLTSMKPDKALAELEKPKKSDQQKAIGESWHNLNHKSHMSLITSLGIPYQADWSKFNMENTPIHQFIPLPDVSSFFNKLKAFAEEKFAEEKLES